jgi:predicted small secreted protein
MKSVFNRLPWLAIVLCMSLSGCNSAHGVVGDTSYPMPKLFIQRWNSLASDPNLTIHQASDPDHNIVSVVLTDSTNQDLVLGLGDVIQTHTGIGYEPEDQSYNFFSPGANASDFDLSNICPLLIQTANPSISTTDAKNMYDTAGTQYQQAVGVTKDPEGNASAGGIVLNVTNGNHGGYICKVRSATAHISKIAVAEARANDGTDQAAVAPVTDNMTPDEIQKCEWYANVTVRSLAPLAQVYGQQWVTDQVRQKLEAKESPACMARLGREWSNH